MTVSESFKEFECPKKLIVVVITQDTKKHLLQTYGKKAKFQRHLPAINKLDWIQITQVISTTHATIHI